MMMGVLKMSDSLLDAVLEIEEEIIQLKEVEHVDGESAASASSYDLEGMFMNLGRLYYFLHKQ